MKLTIRLKDGFDEVYLPLQFRAFWNDDGACYLRTRIYDGKIFFFCAQLLNYTNTSVTNAVESVRDAAIKQLLRDGGLRFNYQKSVLDRFKSAERIDHDITRQLRDFVHARSVWIEYYPPEFASWLSCHHSEVIFNERGEPHWTHCSPQTLAMRFPGIDFTVSSDELASWNDTLTAEGIKRILKDKRWTMRQVAERWGITERHISRVVNDTEREKHWEDAVRGLPALSEKDVKVRQTIANYDS